jgi:hypothetical protein
MHNNPTGETKMADQMTTTAAKALKAMKEAEELKKIAIQDLIKQRDEIDKTLLELGHCENGRNVNGEQKKPCKVCGSFEHDGRFHSKKKRAEQAIAGPTPIPA